MVYKRAAPLVNLRNQHFQTAGRGPGTGPSGPHFENVDFEGKGLKAATPPLPRIGGQTWAPRQVLTRPSLRLWIQIGSRETRGLGLETCVAHKESYNFQGLSINFCDSRFKTRVANSRIVDLVLGGGRAWPSRARPSLGQAKPGRAAVRHGSRAAGRPGSWAAGRSGGPAQPVLWMRATGL